MRSKLQKDYLHKLEKLNYLFPNAYNFLRIIGDNMKEGFWLSTAQNAHLYYKDRYFMYIILSIGSISIQPQYNHRIETNTSDRSNLIFLDPIKKVISELNGFVEGWAKIEGLSTIILTGKTPISFFENMLDLIQKVNGVNQDY